MLNNLIVELPGGVLVEFLVGFRNKGPQDFVVESLDASFRYPMDFNFYIQNFSVIAFNKEISPSKEATFAYSFMPSETFAGRPFGLNINLVYRDGLGNRFQVQFTLINLPLSLLSQENALLDTTDLLQDAVYNETVQIVELEEGLDGETFFLYVFLAAGVVLLLVLGQQTLLSVGRKRTGRKAPVETGTSNPNNVDYEWLPKQTLASLSTYKSLSKRLGTTAKCYFPLQSSLLNSLCLPLSLFPVLFVASFTASHFLLFSSIFPLPFPF